MFNFSFNIFNKQSSRKYDDNIVLNLEQARREEAEVKARGEHDKRVKKSKRSLREMDRPFGIYSGDPELLSSGDSTPKIHFVHKSMPQYKGRRDSEGRPFTRTLKSNLRKIDSGYRRRMISVDQYAHRPDWVKLAPHGLEIYVPKGKTTGTTPASSAVRRFINVLDNQAAMERLSQRTGERPSPNMPEFNPHHPLNLVASNGGLDALKSIFTDIMPAVKGDNLCVCGRAADKHVSAEEAKWHHGNTGEHLEIHKFTPQQVEDAAGGSPMPGGVMRSAASKLRYALLPNSATNSLSYRRGDEGMDGEFMPVVRIGTRAIKFRRLSKYYKDTDKNGEPWKPSKPSRELEEPCKACTDGVINVHARENSMHDEDCLPGKINYKVEVNSEGNTVARPYTRGLGNGRIAYINQEDAPPHKDCDGKGYTLTNDKTNQVKVPCRGCNETGKDLSTVYSGDKETFGAPCPNCGNPNSRIFITDDNTCKECGGRGSFPSKTRKKVKEQPVGVDVNEYEGNPAYLEPWKGGGVVDGWKAHGDKNCTRCHGNDDYVTDSGMPCNCRIGSFDDDKDLVAPPGTRFVHPTHINAPEILYLEGMQKTYGSNPQANPHVRDHDVHALEPSTGKPISDKYISTSYEIGENKTHPVTGRVTPASTPIDADQFTGLWSNGIHFDQDTMDWLNKRSKEHWSKPHAHFTAPSAELEDIQSVLSNFRDHSMNIPGVKVSIPTPKKTRDGRVSLTQLHPTVRPAVQKVENIMKEITGPNAERFHPLLDNVYQEASGVANDHAITGSNESTHWDAYNDSINKLLEGVSRFHGPLSAEHLSSSMSGLPKFKPFTPAGRTPPPEALPVAQGEETNV